LVIALALTFMPLFLKADGNMRREGALTLNQPLDDTKGFYAATSDPANGFAYFAAKYVYKVNMAGPLPTQVGAGVSLGRLAFSAAMDSSAGCAYFAVGANIYQVFANGTNAPTLGSIMNSPFGGSAFTTQLLIDTSDPANHYLYVMTENGNASSTLYKLALNNYPNPSCIIGSASTTAQQPALGYGVIDLTNHCAYYGNFIPSTLPLYLVKFSLGAGANPPLNYGGVALDVTNRSLGGIVLDPANGYGYCDSDGNDLLFGHARVYKWALNGTNAPTLASYVDMHTNEGYCHVAVIKPDRGLLYFSSDLSYPCYVYRFRLMPGTNAPVETGNLPLLSNTNTVSPPWGTNPDYSTNWGEVFARSIVYDAVRDFVYIGRDDADAQVQPYTDQIVKVALDRDETLVALAPDVANTNNTIPYSESFESYANGFDLVGTNGWSSADPLAAVVNTNNYTNTYTGSFPVPGPHQLTLSIDGSVTNRFSPSVFTNVWVDMILEAKYFTDPIKPDINSLGAAPFALCVTTNGHLAVWNGAPSPTWTELLDTSLASNQYARVTIQAAYTRDANGIFYYRVWLNGTPSTNPQTWYATANTNQNSFGSLAAVGHYSLDDVVVRNTDPFASPIILITGIVKNPDGSIALSFSGAPNMNHRVLASGSLGPSVLWSPISTNLAGADGAWQFTDTNTAASPLRFYRASLP